MIRRLLLAAVLLAGAAASTLYVKPEAALAQISLKGGGGGVSSFADDSQLAFGSDTDMTLEWDSGADQFLLTGGGIRVVLADDTIVTLEDSSDTLLTFSALATDNVFEITRTLENANGLVLDITLAAMSGSNTVNVMVIAPVNADHTGSSNILNGISVDSITNDAEAEEYAINFGTGWNSGLLRLPSFTSGQRVLSFAGSAGSAIVPYYNTTTSEQLFVLRDVITSGGTRFTWASAFGAGSSGTVMEVTTAGAAMNGSDTQIGLQLDMVSGNHTGTGNTLTVLDIPAITGDANSNLYGINIGALTGTTGAAGEKEYAINIGTGWDAMINYPNSSNQVFLNLNSTPATTATIVGVGSTVLYQIRPDATAGITRHSFRSGSPAGGGGDALEIDLFAGAMNGSDDLRGLFIDISNGNHTGTANLLSGIYMDAFAGDENSNTHAINIGTLTPTTGAAGETENILKLGDGWDTFIEGPAVALGTVTWTTATDKTANAKSGTLKVVINGTLYHIQLYADS